jgi:hypothetical protein
LKPGGTLVIIGLHRAETLTDYGLAAVSFPLSWMFRLLRGYAEVGAPLADPKETLREIRRECDLLLPGTSLQRRLLFRYSLVWRKLPD